MTQADPDKRIHLGTVIAAHGLKGEVKIKSFTEDPVAIGAYGPVQLDDGSVRALAVRSANRDVVIARLEGVAGRTDAEKLAREKARLYITRAQLGAEDDGDGYFIEDLKGLRALDETGAVRGVVRDVLNFGAGDILVIGGPSGEFMLPFKPPFADAVDMQAGTLAVFIPEGWLSSAAKGATDDEGEGA